MLRAEGKGDVCMVKVGSGSGGCNCGSVACMYVLSLQVFCFVVSVFAHNKELALFGVDSSFSTVFIWCIR